ncbi:MAG: UTP--glucose-1-phosphate uridylyltransferase GalU [Erysipelotrichaceae bacterium]|nr:UTP--glucose-1-phosphate uridylyltransferase GalU [Erysipelotrichaceae bacterium]
MKVRKAIIPAAGLGTRFLPATKAIPKEMLPIVDIPTIQYIVKEALDSGIEEILIIDNQYKECIHTHFSVDQRLENKLLETNKQADYELVHQIGTMAKITYVQQNNPKGLGHAISLGKEFVGNEPFAILLGDDIVVNRNPNGLPALKQLINVYESTSSSVLGVQTVSENDVNKYGVVKPSLVVDERTVEICDFVEKPKKEEAPSRLAVLGRYVITPEIFEILDKQEPGKGGEIQLTDAIKKLLDTQKVFAYDFEGTRYDVGDKFGFVKATIDFSLEREELRTQVLDYIRSIDK